MLILFGLVGKMSGLFKYVFKLNLLLLQTVDINKSSFI